MNLAKKNPIFRCRSVPALCICLFVSILPFAVNATEVIEPSLSMEMQKKIVPCGERPDFFSDHSFVVGYESPPKSVYVGRVAYFWIESTDSATKIFVKHNFKTGKKEFLCASLSALKDYHFTIFGPTLVDRSVEQKVGSTMWHFMVFLNDGHLGIWNQKARLISATDFLSAPAGPGGETAQWIQDNHIRLRKAQGKFNLFLYIDFDQVDTL